MVRQQPATNEDQPLNFKAAGALTVDRQLR
jgi:hypothetical protein